VYVELAEDFSRIQEVLVVVNPKHEIHGQQPLCLRRQMDCETSLETYFLALNANSGRLRKIASQ
jgi:hypothetical protein